MVEIFLLEHLDAFARHGTLRRAAEELHITESALSRSMKKLEATLGVSLFQRENSRISLNETGKTAAEYAKRVLEADREFMEKTVAFDRNSRTIVVGTCAPYPLLALLPVLQERFMGMAITSEITDDDRLLSGVREGLYQIVIPRVRPEPDDGNLLLRKYLDERLYLTVPENHPLADSGSVSFRELRELRVLVNGSIGFWLELCRKELPERNLLIQASMDSMSELIDASSLPFFNSDRMMERGYRIPGRTSVPIRDETARASYYLVCRKSDAKKFSRVFDAACSAVKREENPSE